MAGFGTNIADAFVDNAADKIADAFIPGNGMFIVREYIINFSVFV